MKKLLSIILVVCMMMTVAPVAFAQTADFEVKTAETAYTAKVGETISVPFNLVPAASSADLCLIQVRIPIPEGLTATVTAGKVPVSASSVNVSSTNVNIMYDAGDAVTYTAEDSTMITVNYTAEKAGTYPLNITIAELYNADYDVVGVLGDNVTATGATLTFEADAPSDPAGADACDFKKNSTYVTGEQFEYADVAAAGTDVIEAGIEGLSVVRGGTGSEGTYTKIVADPAGEDDYSLVVHHPGQNWVEGATHINQVVTETLDADVDADYIVMSHKFWYPAGVYIRFYPSLTFKKYSDGSTTNGTGFSAIINGNVYQEGLTGGYALAPSADKWAEWDFIIDTKGLKADLYIDHQYAYTFDFTQGANGSASTLASGEYYISGVKNYTTRFDRYSKVGTAYWDDIQVRSMTAAQYAAIFANDTVELTKTTLSTTEKLPVGTSQYGAPVAWTADNEQVTIAADGSIALAAGVSKVENVVLTASFAGKTKQFTVTIVAEPKYAEYIFGFNADKAYNATSYNAVSDYNFGTADGLKIKNKIVKLDEPSTVYVVTDSTSTRIVDAETYAAFEGSKSEYKNVNYINPFDGNTGDSMSNRYAQVGPEGDKRDAIFGAQHVRRDSRLGGNGNIGTMIHLNVTPAGFTSTDNALTVEVDMLDNRGKDDKVTLQYMSTSGGKTAFSNERPSGNSGEWITVTFTLTDADFSKDSGTGYGDQAQDLRISVAGLPTTISAIRVYDFDKKELTDADYTTINLADYDVVTNVDGSITAKTDITAEEAADAKLYVAYYNVKGDLVGVATSAQVTDGVAQTVVTGASVGANYNPANHTIKTFVWDADLKPLR